MLKLCTLTILPAYSLRLHGGLLILYIFFTTLTRIQLQCTCVYRQYISPFAITHTLHYHGLHCCSQILYRMVHGCALFPKSSKMCSKSIPSEFAGFAMSLCQQSCSDTFIIDLESLVCGILSTMLHYFYSTENKSSATYNSSENAKCLAYSRALAMAV